MRRSGNYGYRHFPDFKAADTVLQADSHIPARLGFGHDPRTFCFDHGRIRRILEAKNIAVLVMIPHRAQEARDAAPLR
jgi:hypothetical protein